MAELPPPGADGNPEGVIQSYYLADGTWVQVMPDGTEYHYPPEDAAANAGGEVPGAGGAAQQQLMYDPNTGNPLGQEFYPQEQYYQQHYPTVMLSDDGQTLVPMNGMAASYHTGDGLPPMMPRNGSRPPTPSEGGGSKKKKKSRGSNSGEDIVAIDGEAHEPEPDIGPLPMHAVAVQSGYWLVDIFSEAFFSLGFKMWACGLFLTTWVIALFYGLNLETACLYRMVAPPDADSSLFWQTIAFASIFLVLSFFVTTVLHCQMSIVREVWQSSPGDTSLFGISVSTSQPPYFVHVILVLLFTVLPVFWAAILTLSTKRTAAYFVQFFLFCSVIVAYLTVLVIYAVMWVNSFRLKTKAYSNRESETEAAKKHAVKYGLNKKKKKRDETESESSSSESESETDEEDRDAATADGEGRRGNRRRRHHRRHRKAKREREPRRKTRVTNQYGSRISGVAWFESERTLQEFGLNPKAVRWMIPVFVLGWIPVTVVAVFFAFDYAGPSWDVVQWLIVGFVILLGFIVLAEANSRLKARYGTAITILFLVLVIFFGILSCGLSGNASLIGIYLFLLLLTHCMLLRKRPFELLPHEVEELFGPSVDRYGVGKGEPFDSYLCLCRNTILQILRCGDTCDVYSVFGKKAPIVATYEKQYRHDNLGLITDQRLLLYNWFLLWIMLAYATGVAPELTKTFTTDGLAMFNLGATGPRDGLLGDAYDLCRLQYNTNYSTDDVILVRNLTNSYGDPGEPAILTLLDLSFMVVDTLSYGTVARGPWDPLGGWWNLFPSLAVDQSQIPETALASIQRRTLGWVDYYDNITNFHVVAVQGVPRGSSFLRTIDAYGEWWALKMTMAFAPFVAAWPDNCKDNWIAGTQFLKRWMGGDIRDVMKPLNEHVATLKNLPQSKTGKQPVVLVIGTGFNGAFARAAAHHNGVSSVAFNSAGTHLMHGAFGMGKPTSGIDHRIINTDADAFNEIGGFGYDATYTPVRCVHTPNDRTYTFRCSYPHHIAAYLKSLCGDIHGRDVNPVLVPTI
jgi:hypothetical protein